MIKYKKLVNTNLFDLTNLRAFYDKIFVKSFPDEDERDSFEKVHSYFMYQRDIANHEYCVVLAYDDGLVVGGCIYDYFVKTNTAFIEYIAVDRNRYSSKLGTGIFEYVCGTLEDMAIKNGYSNVDYIFAEMDNPDLRGDDSPNYKFFNHKLGFRKLEIDYVQPSLEPDKDSVSKLWFIGINKNGRETFDASTLYYVLYDYYMYCFDISNPLKTDVFTETVNSFCGKREVESTAILE